MSLKTEKNTFLFNAVTLLALIAIGVCIRVWGMNVFAYNADEAMLLATAEADSLKQVVNYSFFEASHPPLYYILLHYWLYISHDIAFVRGLSLVFGVALIPLYYAIGKELNGRFTGLFLATLITFCHGCIIQSDIARQYSLYVFLLSASVYFFLLWRNYYGQTALLAYFLFGGAACLTHFSSIFTIFLLTLGQAYVLYSKKAGRQILLQWLMANAAIALIWCAIIYTWQQHTLAVAELYSNPHYPLKERLGNIPLYLRTVFSYMLPNLNTAFIFALAIPFAHLKQNTGRDYLIRLLCAALFLGLLLVVANAYPFEEGRRAMWLLPFIICAFGCTMADGSEALDSYLNARYPSAWREIILVSLIVFFAFSYNPHVRFADSDEYEITTANWQKYTDFLSSYGANTAIIAEKDEALPLTNIFAYSGNDFFQSQNAVAAAPYHNTKIIFDPIHPRTRSKKIFLFTMQQAEEQGFLKNIDTLVFLRSAPVVELMQCATFDKEVHWFTEREFYSPRPSKEQLYVNIPLLIVSKQKFFEQVMSPIGKARQCLTDNHGE
jgi:hypothetical protein